MHAKLTGRHVVAPGQLTCKECWYRKLKQKEYLEGMLDGFSLELHGSSDETSLWCPGFAHLRQGFKYYPTKKNYK
jgi:hypothetical protein